MQPIQRLSKTGWIILGLFCVIIFLGIHISGYKSQLKTYESALDNTVDATIMEIDEHKNIIKSERLKITNKCKKINKNMPHRFVVDGTCEVE